MLGVGRKSSGKRSNAADIWPSGFMESLRSTPPPDYCSQGPDQVGSDCAGNHEAAGAGLGQGKRLLGMRGR